MPRKFLRRVSRQYRQNESAWYLRRFSALLRHPRYFALNRRSVTGAIATGLFISMLPLPGHTALAVVVAVLLGFNLGVAALAAWLNSPLTMLPVFYAEYRLGALLLAQPPRPWPQDVTWAWLRTELGLLWQPLFLGALVAATATTAIVYVGLNAAWRWSAARRLKRRRGTRATSVRRASARR